VNGQSSRHCTVKNKTETETHRVWNGCTMGTPRSQHDHHERAISNCARIQCQQRVHKAQDACNHRAQRRNDRPQSEAKR
jgi:hypothetical protein